ncbi:ArsR/SmtB family transcription factor [Acinetobacter sp. ANC 3832]|uniref:ArsR/SmtB family transcription factor n=1 Tax=Acinetobacter sp. ANC 3832 TaxID=1977874 RepID=UPI000A33F3F5|nr:metalloregulator ArsR/SmtB family transcription factor [Acinetobacter sp. ANC 3832]OTG93258.1 transcriptional regulator [Acinetobacter sp. ANC 3832]
MQNNNFSIDLNKINSVADQLKILSNPDRLKILCILKDGEIHVQNIEQLTAIPQPTLSQQLTLLRKAQLVQTRREGKQIYYSIQDQRVLDLMQKLYELYCQTED